jgi:hypothetical protein
MDEKQLEQCLAMLATTPDWIAEQAARVPADGWDEVIHGAEGGWNRRQMLAHIVTIDRRHANRIRLSAGLPNDTGVSNQSELPPINDWNQQQVDARAGRSIDELLAEMRQNRADLIALVRSLAPEHRERVTIDRANLPPAPFYEWLGLPHDHAVAHMREVTG